MTGEQHEIKPTGPWFRELLLWGAWSISTALGWFVVWIVIIVMLAAFSMPDPDAARIYQDYSPWERLSGPLLTGAIVGAIPGLVMGLLWLVLRRDVGQAAVLCWPPWRPAVSCASSPRLAALKSRAAWWP